LVAAQFIKDRVPVAWSPKSNLGSQQPTNKELPNKTTVIMSINFKDYING